MAVQRVNKEGAVTEQPPLAWSLSPSPPPPLSPTPQNENKCVFLQGMRPAITLAQVFGLLPVTKPSDGDGATFSWKSFRVAFSMCVIVMTLAESILSLMRMIETGVSFYTSVNVIFYTTSMVGSVIFLRLSVRWKTMISYWILLERYITRTHGDPTRLRSKMVTATVIVLGVALVEHTLSILSTIAYVWPCYTRGGFPLVVQGYFLTKYLKVFTVIRYSAWKAMIVLALQIITVFVWNFLDLFIILISMALCARFRQLNQALCSASGQLKPEEFWRKNRETYNALAMLTKTVDDYIGPVVVLSYASNLYFICLQLLVITKTSVHSSAFQDSYFYFSLIYLIIRTCFMSFVAANVFDESQKPKHILFSVPSGGYSREVQRFLTQVNTDAISLTGCNFFSITRSFMLTVAGTIVTYVVILLQFDDESSDPERAQSNNTVSCTCADIGIYSC